MIKKNERIIMVVYGIIASILGLPCAAFHQYYFILKVRHDHHPWDPILNNCIKIHSKCLFFFFFFFFWNNKGITDSLRN